MGDWKDDPLTAPLKLNCGLELKTRIIKGSTTESLADKYGCASDQHVKLYAGWAPNRFGIQIVGHFMIDQKHVENCGNVVVDRDAPRTMAADHLDTLRRLADAGRTEGSLMIVQISHCGRQSRPGCSLESIGPSAKPVLLFGQPMAPLRAEPFTVAEIKDVIAKYVHTAKTLQGCGYDGVQVHAAHGYLPHQFFTPAVNEREDEYGGTLKKRAAFLLEIIDSIRAACGPAFAIGVRLSGQDYEPDGIKVAHTIDLCKMLDEHSTDFIEISGGTSENLACICGPHAMKVKMAPPMGALALCGLAAASFAKMAGFGLAKVAIKKPALACIGIGALAGAYILKLNPAQSPEGWFLQEAIQIKEAVQPKKAKIGTVGGFGSRKGIVGALQAGMDFVSVVSVVCYDKLAVKRLLRGETDTMFHPQRAGLSTLGLPTKMSLPTMLIPAAKSPIKMPPSVGSSTRVLMKAGFTWMWCLGNLAKLAEGETIIPMPAKDSVPPIFAQASAKMAADAQRTKEMEPYWKKAA